MRIALIGYGKMGKRIDELATAQGHEITHRIGLENMEELAQLQACDVAIEFSSPEAAVDNLQTLFRKGIPTVCGTTGWYARYDEVYTLADKHQVPFLHATNFSIGVQLAFAANKHLAKLMDAHRNYLCRIEEWHHTTKKDAPSGTAITFAEGILEHHHAFGGWHLQNGNELSESIPIKAYREEDVPGTHRITYRSEIDEIQLEHRAYNRDGFAQGAIHAAAWLIKQAPGIYTMNDFLKL